jgi:hypothetical protein
MIALRFDFAFCCGFVVAREMYADGDDGLEAICARHVWGAGA